MCKNFVLTQRAYGIRVLFANVALRYVRKEKTLIVALLFPNVLSTLDTYTVKSQREKCEGELKIERVRVI